MGKLTALQVQRFVASGMYPDGNGLYLQVRGPTARSWVLRYMRDRKTRYLGLGSLRKLSLAAAREKAVEALQSIGKGVDPIAAKKIEKQRETLEAARRVTFREAAVRYVNTNRETWRSEKHRQQWDSTLATYAFPVLGALAVQDVDTGLVLKVVEPIWNEKPETASRVRGRVEAVLDWAGARGYRTGDNPARWRGHLEHLLPKPSKVRAVKPHAALPYDDIPNFMTDLRKLDAIAAAALDFTILTASRTDNSITSRWSEFDIEKKIWNIPGESMKGVREHRVPLSNATLAVLKRMAALKKSEFVFPGAKSGRPLSEAAMLATLQRMNRADLTVHGFRSTFKDWAAERTNFPNEVSEMALAHAISDKTEAAYRRGDLFEKRRRLMDAWAEYCAKPAATGAVVPMRA